MKIVWLILKWLLILIVVVLVLGFIYEQYARYRAKKNFTDGGTYVEVDGHRMHYVRKGAGAPTVVFESGLDFTGHMSWRTVQSDIAKTTTTLSYDRIGILRSDPSPKPRTCENIAEELYGMLESLKAPKPYIIVAHSMGGLTARCYVDKHADTLGGIIFVDASHPEQIERAPQRLKKMLKVSPLPDWVISFLVRSGIVRIAVNFGLAEFMNDDKNINAIRAEINTYLPQSYRGAMEEYKMLSSMLQASRDVQLGKIPLTILVADHQPKDEQERIFLEYFQKLQKENLALATHSKIIYVDSGHYIQKEKPDVVIEAIRKMVEETR